MVVGSFRTIKGLKKGERKWKSEGESRQFRPQYYYDQPEHTEETSRFEETCCHSHSRKKLAGSEIKEG